MADQGTSCCFFVPRGSQCEMINYFSKSDEPRIKPNAKKSKTDEKTNESSDTKITSTTAYQRMCDKWVKDVELQFQQDGDVV